MKLNEAENGDPLDEQEGKAIMALRRLAAQWPPTLTLASMGGTLVVVPTDDERFLSAVPSERGEAVLWSTLDIPNTGGDW